MKLVKKQMAIAELSINLEESTYDSYHYVSKFPFSFFSKRFEKKNLDIFQKFSELSLPGFDTSEQREDERSASPILLWCQITAFMIWNFGNKNFLNKFWFFVLKRGRFTEKILKVAVAKIF